MFLLLLQLVSAAFTFRCLQSFGGVAGESRTPRTSLVNLRQHPLQANNGKPAAYVTLSKGEEMPGTEKRQKRQIFGKDDRTKVVPHKAGQEFPFNTTVKIWSPRVRCSGVLISTWHVLTAAHCIHDGQSLLASLSAVQVASLQRNGKLTYSSINSFYLAPEWTSGNDSNSEYDYAVLRLSEPLFGNVLKMRPLPLKLGTPIQFASFPEDKPYGSLWFVRCEVTGLIKDTGAKCDCDAFSGSSGAGIYIEPPFLGVKEPTLVGVLSNAWTLMYGWQPVKSANVLLRIREQLFQAISSYLLRTRGR